MRPEAGASPVGKMDMLPKGEAWWIRALRLWCDGLDGQIMLRDELCARMGPDNAEAFFTRFSDLVALLLRHGRRPLMRHGSPATASARTRRCLPCSAPRRCTTGKRR